MIGRQSTIWNDFYDRLARERRNTPNPVLSAAEKALDDFCFKNYGSIFDEIESHGGVKIRASIPVHPWLGPDKAPTIRQLFSLSDLVVLSPSPVGWYNCATDSRLNNFTSTAVSKFGNFAITFGFGDIIADGQILTESRALSYLPLHLDSDSYSWSYERGDFRVEPIRLGDWRDLPDPDPMLFKYQLDLISQDVFVSEKLGCTHVFPFATEIPIVLSGNIAGNAIGFIMAGLKIPTLERCDFATMVRIKNEEFDSFEKFQSAIEKYTKELSSIDLDTRQIQVRIDECRQDIILAPLERLERKIKRLQRYSFYRASACVVALTGFTVCAHVYPDLNEYGRVVGGSTVLGVIASFINYLEKRSNFLDDGAHSYIQRLSKGK